MPNIALIEHNATQFAKQIIELAPGVWGAIGFAASNVYVVEGKASLTVIDTSESTGAAENILAEIRARTDKPVGRIIYTHSHRDHISGASIFAANGDVPILASALFSSDLVAVNEETIAAKKALGRRTQAQFGIGLSSSERISLGCGPGNRPMSGLGAGHIPPTELITDDCDIDLDGVTAQLIMAPGETTDHMAVWLPELKILFSGDNWYHAFPNLYAIRGTSYRDYVAWANSLQLLENMGAEILAPGHTLPVRGALQVQEVLSTTRAAIVHVMRETALMMDQGLSMDDIVANIALPPELADKPWLGEYYGKIAWSARAFAVGTLGWYDGNATNLGCLGSKARAEHMAHLAGGADAMLQAARDTPCLQWRLELCDHLIALEQPACVLKAEAMLELAETEINATARNTYIWQAKQLMKKVEDS